MGGSGNSIEAQGTSGVVVTAVFVGQNAHPGLTQVS